MKQTLAILLMLLPIVFYGQKYRYSIGSNAAGYIAGSYELWTTVNPIKQLSIDANFGWVIDSDYRIVNKIDDGFEDTKELGKFMKLGVRYNFTIINKLTKRDVFTPFIGAGYIVNFYNQSGIYTSFENTQENEEFKFVKGYARGVVINPGFSLTIGPRWVMSLSGQKAIYNSRNHFIGHRGRSYTPGIGAESSGVRFLFAFCYRFGKTKSSS